MRPSRGRPWPPTRPVKMRVHSYASTRRDAPWSPPTKAEADSLFGRETSKRQVPRCVLLYTESSSLRVVSSFLTFPTCGARRRPGIPLFICHFSSASKASMDSMFNEQPPFSFTPTYQFMCPTRRESSYHEAATKHILPFAHTLAHLLARIAAAQASMCSAPFWYPSRDSRRTIR